MRLLSLAMILLLAGAAPAQESLQVLPSESNPRALFYAFLVGQAQKHFDARKQLVAALKTPEEIRQRQAYLKIKFIEALGGLPDKTPLNGKVLGTLKADGFRVEKVVFESRPNHHVSANLYIPNGKGPFPGVLLPCGHSANGKAAEAYQRAAILMALNGLVVLCYDPIGQGERYQIIDAMGRPLVKSSTSEHTLVGVGALLVGKSTATYRIWDGIRALDYLASRPEVDAKRLGCTGNSGGGTLTAYLMALDDRIVAAAPSCYLTTLERLFATLGPQDAEQNIPGQVAFGMDHADYISMRAPRPTLMCVATRDFFDINGAWATFREASLIYSKLGHGERAALFEYDDTHGFSRPRREAAMRWMRRWLLGKDDAPSEGNFPSFKDEELQCTRSGQVLEDYKGKSAFQLNQEEALALAPQRAKFVDLKADAHKKIIRTLLAVPDKLPSAKVSHKDSYPSKGALFYKAVFAPEAGIQVPGLWYVPTQAADKKITIYLDQRGMAAAAGPGGALDLLLKQGRQVLALDLRGCGETAAAPAAKGGFFGTEMKTAFMGIHLSRPLLGQRVYDLVSIVNAIAKDTPGQEVEVIATGSLGPVALHAAALAPLIKSVVIDGGLVSWQNVVNTPMANDQLVNAVPGVLRFYDLPDLAATLTSLSLTLRHPVDAVQKSVSQADLDAAYKVARDRFAKASAGKGTLTLQAQ